MEQNNDHIYFNEARNVLSSGEGDIEKAAHELVQVLMSKPDKEKEGVLKTDCRAVDKCLDSCRDCLFNNLNNNDGTDGQ